MCWGWILWIFAVGLITSQIVRMGIIQIENAWLDTIKIERFWVGALKNGICLESKSFWLGTTKTIYPLVWEWSEFPDHFSNTNNSLWIGTRSECTVRQSIFTNNFFIYKNLRLPHFPLPKNAYFRALYFLKDGGTIISNVLRAGGPWRSALSVPTCWIFRVFSVCES